MPNRKSQLIIPIQSDLAAILLERFPPIYPSVFMQRITLDHGVAVPADLNPKNCLIYGTYNNPDRQVQSLLVEVDGQLRRADRKPYWITVSLGPNASPVEGGEVPVEAVDFLSEGYEFLGRPVIKPARQLKPRSVSLVA